MGYFDESGARIKVLFFAANPVDPVNPDRTPRLQLDEEIRLIDHNIRMAEHRDALELIHKLAPRPDDLLQELNRYKPQIVHFSGHGQSTGEIILVDQQGFPKPVAPQAIRALFRTLRDNIRLVVLNACYSYAQAEAITEVIDCAIGMSDAIGDKAAITFASSFYRAIGFGRSVQEAFDQGIVALMLEGIPEENTPRLHVRKGLDASSIVILNPETIAIEQDSQKFLQSAQNALKRSDYDTAGKNAEKVLEIVDDGIDPEKTAQARFLLALVTLQGIRPFRQALPVMRSVEQTLRLAIAAHPTFSNLLLLGMCKRDYARNGYPQYLNESHELLGKANMMNLTQQDKANLELLTVCQPHLTSDFLR